MEMGTVNELEQFINRCPLILTACENNNTFPTIAGETDKMKRRFYLDNIRSLTILLVVLYHVFYMFNGVEGCRVIGPFSDFQIQDSVQYLLYPWFMVILFIISGMCAAYYLGGHTAKEFVRERTRKLLVPSTVGLVVFQWIQGVINARIYNIAGTMDTSVPKSVSVAIIILSGCGVLWFVQVLWLFSMLLPPVVRIDKGRLYSAAAKTPVWLIVLLAVPFWASAQVLNTPVVAVYRFGIYGFAFFAGYFLFSHEEVTDRLTKYWLPLTVVSVVLGVLYTVLHFGKNYAVAPCVNCPLACAYSWFACLSVLALGKKFLDRDGRFWSFINRNSWGIYIFHYLGASSSALLLRGSAVPPFAQYILCLLASLFASFFLFHLISRIPILRWCVLGM